MFEKWLSATSTEWFLVLVSATATYVAILVYTRIAGLRSFAKLSAADFAMTVAVGSLFGSTIATPNPSLLLGLTAIGSLYFGQWTIAKLRCKSDRVRKHIDNQPLLLMHHGQFIDDHMQRGSVTRGDVFGKLRECNALDLAQVHAVVMEPTGDISVLHGDVDTQVSPELLQDVIGVAADGERVGRE